MELWPQTMELIPHFMELEFQPRIMELWSRTMELRALLMCSWNVHGIARMIHGVVAKIHGIMTTVWNGIANKGHLSHLKYKKMHSSRTALLNHAQSIRVVLNKFDSIFYIEKSHKNMICKLGYFPVIASLTYTNVPSEAVSRQISAVSHCRILQCNHSKLI